MTENTFTVSDSVVKQLKRMVFDDYKAVDAMVVAENSKYQLTCELKRKDSRQLKKLKLIKQLQNENNAQGQRLALAEMKRLQLVADAIARR